MSGLVSLGSLAIFVSGVAAGTINAVAGGGTLLSFPVLLWLGRDPIAANVANTLALGPGSLAGAYAFRRELGPLRPLLLVLLPPAVVGAVAGAWLLIATPARWFGVIVPGLILVATILLAIKRPLLAALALAFPARGRDGAEAPAADAEGVTGGAPQGRRRVVLTIVQLLVAIYGGYFGAAMGIIMLAAFGLARLGTIHQRNGLKNATSAAINVVAAIFFVLRTKVYWTDVLLLSAGAITGGTFGGAVGRRLNARVAEGLVVVIGIVAAVVQIVRR